MMIDRRLVCHASLLATIGLALIIVRLPWQPLAQLPENRLDFSVVVADPTPRADSRAGTARELLLPSISRDSDSLSRITELHTEKPNSSRPTILTYTIAAGDTPYSIANRFGLKPETILWGNPLLTDNAEALSIGAVINILPADGALHYAAEGDTLERLQLLYGVPVEDIISYPGNDFPEEPPYTLTPGQKIIVPGGRKPITWKEPGPPVIAGRGRKSPGYFSGPLVKTGTGYFIWPVPSEVITQYYWAGHPALDIDTYAGQPIVAADSGTVIFSGWDTTGYGNLVIIDHGNDFWTYYAHNSQNLVSAGQGVDQGQTIALSGSTGNSTGDHLDFRIRYQAAAFLDPLNFLP